MSLTRLTMDEVNALGRDEFIRVFGGVFEHSPWVAEMAWAARPFASLDFLHRRMCETVALAGGEKQLLLIRAHPDLVGRAALAGTLTAASTQEQRAAGLDCLSEEEVTTFQNLNRQYHEQFGFPFIICARLNKKEAILAAFPLRLKNAREEEIRAALEEIYKIARLRLADLIQDSPQHAS